MSDEALLTCNKTELLCLARAQGLPPLRKSLSIEVLASIVAGEMEPRTEHFSGTAYTREKLQQFIFDNIAVTRSQLPGCTGKCTVYPCSEGRHALCFYPNRGSVQ